METLAHYREESFSDIVTLSATLLRPGISQEESQVLYNKWASLGTYDMLSEQANFFAAHDKLIEGILELSPTRRDINILDVGAGTGLIGQRLFDLGFHNLDAVDPSHEMLKVAEKKQVYERSICSFFTEQPIDGIENDTYDMLLMCGVCGPGAVPVESFKEAVRIVKPGGYIVNCMRAEYLQTIPEFNAHWEPVVSALVNEGKWRLVSEHKYPNHYFHYEGLRLVYQVL